MIGKIIISVIFIPLNALMLWVVNSFMSERESYRKALLAATFMFIISLFRFVSFQGFHGSIASNFVMGWGSTILSFFVLWGLYKYDFWSLISMWVAWNVLQFPFNILQIKILNLPWDTILRCF